MSAVTDALTPKEQARFAEAARVCGLWYLHNQNRPGQPWGGVDQSADLGRFLYEYFPATGECRGTGVWSQGLAACLLQALSEAPQYEGSKTFAEAARLGAGYLMSLQHLDGRRPHALGGFREHHPQDTWSYPRDGATGGFCLATMFKHTGVAEYLDRAKLFCDWYSGPGSTDETWPHDFYDFEKADGSCKVPGDWQAGGALCYLYTAKGAGDDEWIETGYRPVMQKLLELGDPSEVDGTADSWHGESRITVGNDDFATVALMAAFLEFDDEQYLELARKRVRWMMAYQDDDGSFPNGGGTFVTAITLLEFVELVERAGLPDETAGVIESLLKAARFGLTLQNRDPGDVRAYGGLWGQSSYGVGRDRIHNRSTSYAGNLWLRLAGEAAPCLSPLAWFQS
ncbi:MAG: hypothetical protein R6V58_11000 [Planctomycetota bacterium]